MCMPVLYVQIYLATAFYITLLGEGKDRSTLALHTGAQEEAPIKHGALALLCFQSHGSSLSLDTNHEHTQAEQAQSR